MPFLFCSIPLSLSLPVSVCARMCVCFNILRALMKCWKCRTQNKKRIKYLTSNCLVLVLLYFVAYLKIYIHQTHSHTHTHTFMSAFLFVSFFYSCRLAPALLWNILLVLLRIRIRILCCMRFFFDYYCYYLPSLSSHFVICYIICNT